MTKDQQKEFKTKLKILLREYNASIGFECSDSSDTHGINGEKIVITCKYKAEGDKWAKDHTIIAVNGWWLEPNDL